MHPPCCKTLTCEMLVLFAFNLQTKCEMSSFIRSKDMARAPECRNQSRDPDHAHPLGGQGLQRLILHVANSCTQFEDSSCSRSGDISRVQNSKMCHVILTTPTWGTVSHQNANTSGSQLAYKSEASSCSCCGDITWGVKL